jgi:hypothetical protein
MMNHEYNRRQFLRGASGLMGGIFAARVAGLFPEAQPALAQGGNPVSVERPPTQVDVGELYGGFLLLPDGAPIPDFVQTSRFGVPIFCGVGHSETEPTVTSRLFNTAEELAEYITFPIYTFQVLSNDLHLLGANLIEHETGEVYAISVDFQSYNQEIEDLETTVSIWAYPDPLKPQPLWSIAPVEPGRLAVIPEKVDFLLPTPGVLYRLPKGFVFHWIEDEILYTLIAEHTQALERIQQELLMSLKRLA